MWSNSLRLSAHRSIQIFLPDTERSTCLPRTLSNKLLAQLRSLSSSVKSIVTFCERQVPTISEGVTRSWISPDVPLLYCLTHAHMLTASANSPAGMSHPHGL
jgi:hypothetical protein